MVRVRSALKIFQMAAHTSGGCQIVIVVDMTIGAFTRRHSMSTCQQESGGGVIKFRVQPVVGVVASLACGGELCADVIGIVGRLKILDVARIALSRKRLELGTRTALVARIAIHGGMGSCQREAIVVILNLLNRNLPSANGVALFAICS